MTKPQAPKHTALLPVRETFEAAFYESALLDGMAELYPMGIKALRVGDAYDVRYGRLNTLWEGWQLRSSIEPDPSSSAQEVRAALQDAKREHQRQVFDLEGQVRCLRSHVERTAELPDDADLTETREAAKLILGVLDRRANQVDAWSGKALASAPPVRSNAEGDQ